MTDIPQLELRRAHLTVPRNPHMLRPDLAVWQAKTDRQRANLEYSGTPSPLTDTERLAQHSGESVVRWLVDEEDARRRLRGENVEFVTEQGRWVWGRISEHDRALHPVISMGPHYDYRALIEITQTNIPRLLGYARMASMFADGLLSEEVSDPERYLDSRARGVEHDLIVAGTDPDTGEPRIDSVGEASIQFYFGL